jgi:hypothetical protein
MAALVRAPPMLDPVPTPPESSTIAFLRLRGNILYFRGQPRTISPRIAGSPRHVHGKSCTEQMHYGLGIRRKKEKKARISRTAMIRGPGSFSARKGAVLWCCRTGAGIRRSTLGCWSALFSVGAGLCAVQPGLEQGETLVVETRRDSTGAVLDCRSALLSTAMPRTYRSVEEPFFSPLPVSFFVGYSLC